MIGGTITEFIDKIYYGQEIVFLYKGKKYFIQGWWSDDRTSATMVLEDVYEGPFTGYKWEYHSDKMRTCAEVFLSAPIWEGKDFPQIESDVSWIDW